MQLSLAPDDTGAVSVDDRPIAWVRWGRAAPGPAIVLVHGASAHLGWWDSVVGPLVAAGRRVGPLELSGHGDSGHRDAYDGDTWAREVLAVIAEVAGGPALLVGHSLGGRIAILAAAREPALVPRLVLVDALIRAPADRSARRRAFIPGRLGPRAVHADLDTAVATFRLRPREDVADADLLRRVAAGAYRPVPDGGWTLKADLNVFGRTDDEALAAALTVARQPVTMIHGRDSAVLDAAGLEFLAATHAGQTELITLDGHHHLTFDQAPQVAEIIVERWTRLAEPV